MEAELDSNWVEGDPLWWPRSKIPGGERKAVTEVDPPEAWAVWRRQRLKPPLPRFVLAPAWSLLFFVCSIIPLVFPGRTPDDQTVALVLFAGAFFLLLIQPMRIANQQPDGSMFRWKAWLMFGDRAGLGVLAVTAGGGLLTFAAHIVVDVRWGWASYALFFLLWLHILYRSANSLSPPSARWLARVEVASQDLSECPDGWQRKSHFWKRGPIFERKLAGGRRLELYGVSRAGADFIAFHLRHSSGLLHDPFANPEAVVTFHSGPLGACGPRLSGLQAELAAPPLEIPEMEWPESLIPPSEEE
jgi:hypothetical protein